MIPHNLISMAPNESAAVQEHSNVKFYDWLGVHELSSNSGSDDSDIPELDEEWKASMQATMCDAIDPKDHVSTTYFAFDRETYDIMLADLQGQACVNLQTLKACRLREIHDLKKWRRIKDMLALNKGLDRVWLCLKENPHLLIAPMEEWAKIVQQTHCNLIEGNHLGVNASLEVIKAHWCVDMRRYGIPISFIKETVKSCVACNAIDKQVNLDTFPDLRNKLEGKELPKETFSVSTSDVENVLASIMVKHKVRLVKARSTRCSGGSKTYVDYSCHRGGRVERKGSSKRRLRISKKCGCPFRVQVEFVEGLDNAAINVYGQHQGHIPGSRNDLYHLPVHPTVVESCMDDLFDVGTCRHVARMSTSKEHFHFHRASELDKSIYRFFMIPKEIEMMSFQLRVQGN